MLKTLPERANKESRFQQLIIIEMKLKEFKKLKLKASDMFSLQGGTDTVGTQSTKVMTNCNNPDSPGTTSGDWDDEGCSS